MSNVCLCSMFAFAVFALPGLVQESVAHPFHVSFAEVDWNSESGKLEVALKIDPDDLEQAVRRHCGKRIDIDKAESAAAIEAYIRETFLIRLPSRSGEKKVAARSKSTANARKDFKWVGSEIDTKSAWLFFEIAAKDGPEGMVVENFLLAEAPQPSNTVHVRAGKRTSTMTFDRKNTRRVIKFPTRHEPSKTP